MLNKIIIGLGLSILLLIGIVEAKDIIDTQNLENTIESKTENTTESKIQNNVGNIRKNNVESKVESIGLAVDRIVGSNKENVGIYYYNFITNEQFTLNEDMKFVAASLKKIPLAMQIADKLNSGEITLQDRIRYIEELDYQEGTGSLQNEEYIGYRTVEELLELAITQSDNIAYNMLKRFANNTLIEYINTIVSDKVQSEEYIKFTAKQTFEMLNKLYSEKDSNQYYSKVIELMKNTVFNETIDKYLPEGIVAHKIGSYCRYYHDAAIVFGDEPYILVVLTKDIGELNYDIEYFESEEERNLIDWGQGAWELIANISKEIYSLK